MAAVASVRGKGGLGPVEFVRITVGMFHVSFFGSKVLFS